MILSKGKPKILGLRLGEGEFNLLHDSIVLTGKFMLLNNEGEAVGMVTKGVGWSEKTVKALADLSKAMEEDLFPRLFEGDPEVAGEQKPEEPQQF